jgi:hypothetical protein
MSSFLYYSISSNLTEDQIIEIDGRVAKNRKAIHLFFRELPSNSKRKVKRIFVYGLFIFQVGQPLVTCTNAVIIPLPTAIERLLTFEQDKILGNKNYYPQIDGCQNSGKIIQTGNGTILELQQEVSDTSSNDIDEIMLVKDDGILPGADGFPLNNNPRRRHPFGRPRMKGLGINIDPPQAIQGLGNIPEGPKVRSFIEVDTGMNARRGNRGDQCPASQFNMEKEYTLFMEDMSQKGIEVECDQQRFNDLSVNRETGVIDEKSIFEAKGGLQGEGQKMYKNLSRPANPDVRLDFEATHIKTGKRIFLDHKGMIDFQSLADQGKDISRFPSHETVAYRMGQDIPSQKERFIGLPQGPKSANEVLHLVNFDKIRNSLEKPSLVSAVLNGAEDSGCGDNIAFINFE